MLVAMLDEEEAPIGLMPIASPGSAAQVRALVSLLPVGMALVDRDGRFLHMNDAFIRATGVNPVAPPLYPGDLVVREDKAALADAVRRFAGGAQHSADMAVRLNDRAEEPIALSIAGARGLGEAAVVLSLRDTGEEGKLKRQVAQATKMQAVGQLAGGVAHDFNNILTAIIGHCDLMLMRHSPGDSDYDDIQQIRANSNRAASLTRQLLAFSRQQTLRPQVLQLPDVISEVSNLLKRLLGETVQLVVNHGRGLGSVRADPGQLEQVVVNLAVNARDAMLAQGGRNSMLTIETLATTAQEVRAMGDDVLPVGDYVTLKVSDTGAGIPPTSCRRSSNRSSPPRKWARAPASACRPSMASSSSRAAISLPNRTPGGGRPSSSTCRSMPPPPSRRGSAPTPGCAANRPDPPGDRARSCWSRMRTWSGPSPSAR